MMLFSKMCNESWTVFCPIQLGEFTVQHLENRNMSMVSNTVKAEVVKILSLSPMILKGVFCYINQRCISGNMVAHLYSNTVNSSLGDLQHTVDMCISTL